MNPRSTSIPEKWLSTLRHDLRTPVNHILGYSELLEEELGGQSTEALQDLEKIRTAARNILQILEDRTSFQSAVPPKAAIPLPSTPPPTSSLPGKILIVDDDAGNRETLRRRLAREGHAAGEAANGLQALEAMKSDSYDLVLLDVLMPEMDGIATLAALKDDPGMRHVPVIMISALDEMEAVVRCIEAGAEDFLPKPFDATLLRARIGSCLEKKRLRDTEQAHLRTIEETQNRLFAELREAERYVASILPAPVDEPLKIRWIFRTSTELGGDAFGYHWIDDRYFAIYLLDVCGHGVGAALLSVVATNVLRSQTLVGADLRSPREVLAALNAAFQMEQHNNMFFTIWYGVYDTATRRLRHASGGHPPAILLAPNKAAQEIHAPGTIVGVVEDATFPEEEIPIPPGSRLLVFSDGAYELHRPSGEMLTLGEFVAWADAKARGPDMPEDFLAQVRKWTGRDVLEDDLSMICVDFPLEEPLLSNPSPNSVDKLGRLARLVV